MSLIITEGKYGDIYANYYSCHSYYIIKFSSYPYNLQADLSIDGKVISSGEMVCEVTFFQSISILVIMFYKKINPIIQFFSKDNNKWQCQRNML